MRLHLVLGAASALLLVACDTARIARDLDQTFTTEESLARKSVETHAAITGDVPLYDRPVLAAYIERVGQRVVRSNGLTGSYRFFLLDDPEVNAFAVPGGLIYVDRGLLALLDSEDQLAAVLGHELGHLQLGHSSARERTRGGTSLLLNTASTGGTLLGLLTFNPLLLAGSQFGEAYTGTVVETLAAGFGREQELAADRFGATAAAKAGYAPTAGSAAIGKLQAEAEYTRAQLLARGITPPPQHGIFASHPDNLARLQAMTTLSASLPRQPRAAEADYLGQIDGMRYGRTERLGLQRGDAFYDGLHQRVMTVPKGWYVNQSRASRTVAFTAPQSAAVILFNSQKIVDDLDVAGFVQLYLSGARLNGRVVNQGGRKVWRGTADIRDLRYEATGWIERGRDGDLGYLLMGLRADDADGRAIPWPATYDRFAREQRAMRKGEQSKAVAPDLRIRSAAAGERYASLAKAAPFGAQAEPLLRLINGQYPNGEPAKGQRLKTLP